MTELLDRFLKKKWVPYPKPRNQAENIANYLAFLIRDLAEEVIRLEAKLDKTCKGHIVYGAQPKPP